jgi:hypothetical protein
VSTWPSSTSTHDTQLPSHAHATLREWVGPKQHMHMQRCLLALSVGQKPLILLGPSAACTPTHENLIRRLNFLWANKRCIFHSSCNYGRGQQWMLRLGLEEMLVAHSLVRFVDSSARLESDRLNFLMSWADISPRFVNKPSRFVNEPAHELNELSYLL